MLQFSKEKTRKGEGELRSLRRRSSEEVQFSALKPHLLNSEHVMCLGAMYVADEQ